jgi:hypothetical protein
MAVLPGQNPWQVKLLRQQEFLKLGAKVDLGIEQNRINSNVPYRGKYNIRLQRVLSNSKFPDDISVIYAYPNPLSYRPRSQGEYREVKHVILTSFGVYWDSQVINAGRRVVTSGSDGVGIVYSEEADPSNNFHSPNRMWEGIRHSVDPTKTVSGAHFYVDRLGNLVVVGDVDMSMEGSAPSIGGAVIVALEDAGYVYADDWYATRPNSRAVAFGDNRNMLSFGISGPQYNTLAVLLRKLELAFPDIREGASNSRMSVVSGRGVSLPFAERDGLALKEVTEDDPGGYITDSWPNLVTEEAWKVLLEDYVDLRDYISEEDVFKGDDLLVMPWLGDVPPATADTLPKEPLAQAFGEELKDQAGALQRVYNLLNSSAKPQLAEEGARERLAESDYIDKTISDRVNLMESAENPSDGVLLFGTTTEEQDTDPTTDDSWEE